MSSVLITLEGGDGSGKSTQAKLLCEFLRIQGYDVELLHEPGGTEYGNGLRYLLLEAPKVKKFKIDIRAQVLGFCSARAQLIYEKILPRLNKLNTITICDRFADSTVAYQIYGGGVPEFKDIVESLLKFATHEIRPDLTIYLDISPEMGIERIKGRVRDEDEPHLVVKDQQLSFIESNHFDERELKFHRAVRDGYEWLIARDPDRWWRVAADRPINIIEQDIHNHIMAWLKEKSVEPKSSIVIQKHKKLAQSDQQSIPLKTEE